MQVHTIQPSSTSCTEHRLKMHIQVKTATIPHSLRPSNATAIHATRRLQLSIPSRKEARKGAAATHAKQPLRTSMTPRGAVLRAPPRTSKATSEICQPRRPQLRTRPLMALQLHADTAKKELPSLRGNRPRCVTDGASSRARQRRKATRNLFPNLAAFVALCGRSQLPVPSKIKEARGRRRQRGQADATPRKTHPSSLPRDRRGTCDRG